MLAPMLLGYAMGAIGVYALLYRLAPVSSEVAEAAPAETQVFTLFEDEAPIRQAA